MKPVRYTLATFLLLIPAITLAEQTETDNPVLEPTEIVQPTADAQTVIVEPQPLVISSAGDDNNLTDTRLEEERNPFDQQKTVTFKADYGEVSQLCSLQGIIEIGGLVMGLFSIEDKDDKKMVGHGIGEVVRIFHHKTEYIFKIKSFGKRSATLVGENNKEYEVWL